MVLKNNISRKEDYIFFKVNMRVCQGRSPVEVRAQNRVPAIRTRNMNVMAVRRALG